MDLFKNKSASESDDTTDSEESVYSGLEEEPDLSEEEVTCMVFGIQYPLVILLPFEPSYILVISEECQYIKDLHILHDFLKFEL